MKTHEIAKLLGSLATNEALLNQGPGAEITTSGIRTALSEVTRLMLQSPNIEASEAKLMKKTDEIAVTLKALISLSKYSKQHWVSIIEEFRLPIELNPRASSRDVVGKVLSYLEAHPEVLRKQGRTSAKNTPSNLSNLEDTLNKLINYK